ncbi:hypothetical protein XENOCAPTIV_000791 [Xenoophorus captivus]|uniref:Uncharacterized protein n=1 Tax=Xenoophorus captivus TaxID=1517983 RepID=A0ABV0QP28_9TELE
MTAKPVKNLSATSSKHPPESCPVQTLGWRCLASFPPSPSAGHLCQHAHHRVPASALLHLLSLQADLTPYGIYKDLFLKRTARNGTRLILQLHFHVHIKSVMLGGDDFRKGDQTFRP